MKTRNGSGRPRPKTIPSARSAQASEPGQLLHTPPQTVVYWGRLLEAIYNRQFVVEMRPLRTTISVWRILTWLYESEPLTVGAIAERSHIERTVVSRLLDRMAKQGLIMRTPKTNDRRISETRITTKGRRVFDRMRPIRRAVYERAIRGIAPEELELTCQVITRMIDNLGASHERFIRRLPLRE